MTFKLLLIAAIVATASAGCHERHITNTFHYFDTGSATGCEQRDNYLYEYHGSNCIWTSPPTALRDLGKYDYEWMRVEFKVADYGKLEYSDYVKVEMAPCLNGKCERFYQTELIRDDTKMKGLDRTGHARYYGKHHVASGWYWQTLYQAKGSHANWMYQLDKHHNQVKIRITLSNEGSSRGEYHILDNLEVKGWACDKPVEKVVKCKTTSCSYSSGHTHVYSKMLNDNGSKNTSHERWTCAKAGRGCTCMCHSKYSCTLTHHHTSGYKRAFNHC